MCIAALVMPYHLIQANMNDEVEDSSQAIHV